MPSEKVVLYQLANGLNFIHSQHLVHGAICPENVVIFSSSSSETALLKWAGFGLFKPTDPQGRYALMEVKGKLNWLAPELLEHLVKCSEQENSPTIKMRLESDVFPAGCLFFLYITRVHPFGSGGEIVANIMTSNMVNSESKKIICPFYF